MRSFGYSLSGKIANSVRAGARGLGDGVRALNILAPHWEMVMHADEITGTTIEIAIEIHRTLGPGLLECVYEAILAHELQLRGFNVRRQQAIRFQYGGMLFDEAFRADLIVEDTVVVEIKAVARLNPVYARQILTYLRLLDLPAGLVLNFGEKTMLAGTKRIVNKLPPFQQSRVRVNRAAHATPTH